MIDPTRTDAERLGCPTLPGMTRKREKKSEHLNPVFAASEFQFFKFIDSDGRMLSDLAGRTVFSMLPSTAERLASSMGATAKRV